jgi:diadenosine tetraphosphate (Ap4A) HIT family hydrolase
VYADIAPVKAGHLLLLAPGHDLTMASALNGNAGRWRYVDAVREAYLRTFRGEGLTILEHGSGGAGHRRDCIEHAHWHLLPFECELEAIIDEDLRPAVTQGDAEKKRLSDIRSLDARYGERNYLLYLDHGKDPEPTSSPASAWVYSLETSLPYQQYTRSVGYRYTAGAQGQSVNALDWDWALHAGGELVEATMARQHEFAQHVDAALGRPLGDAPRAMTNTPNALAIA